MIPIRPFRAQVLRSLVLPLALAGMAAPAAAETLADAVAAAYARNPILREQRFRQQANDEQYTQARAQYGPQLNGQVGAGLQRVRTQGLNFPSDSNTAQVTLTQPLYTSGRLRGDVAAARANVRAGQEQLRLVEQQLVQQVVAVYAAVVRDEARLAVGRENVRALQDQLRENRARRRVGDVTLTDVGQADARLAAGESQLALLEGALNTSRGDYLQVVGQNPGTLEPLPPLGALPVSIEAAFALAEANNPDLSIARQLEQVSAAQAAAARGERGPSVGLSATAAYSNEFLRIDGRDGRRTLSAGLTLSQPLFNSGAIQSRVREADARNSADQVAIDGARRQALQDVLVAWNQLAAARQALVAGERQVASAQLAYAGMTREARNGLRSTIDTLNAEQELQAAQLNFLQTRFNEYTARAALLSAAGVLRAGTVAPGIEIYDPEEHFRRVANRGATPVEFIARGLDRIGSAPVRPLPYADLAGAEATLPATAAALPPTPGPELTQKPLTPIFESRLVPASELPDGMPRIGTIPDRPAAPPGGGDLSDPALPNPARPNAPRPIPNR